MATGVGKRDVATQTLQEQRKGQAISTEDRIVQVTDEVAELLVAKNRAYGDSALDPVRVFSKATPVEQILVRLDDKLSRLARGHEYPGDDTIMDLIGYLVLLLIARDGAADSDA